MSGSSSKYLTISAISEGFYKEKGSKFIAYAIPCSTEDEVKQHISRLRRENPQAVHVCTAFRLGSEKKLYRSSDDGEPSNSAGPPILGQIQSFDLTNILIAIVRYYGGTNLGVGGLINAYRTSAKEALDNATIVEDEDRVLLEIQFDYAAYNNVMKLLKAGNCNIIEQTVDNITTMTVSIPESNDEIRTQLEQQYSRK